jgi:hypothetical protein
MGLSFTRVLHTCLNAKFSAQSNEEALIYELQLAVAAKGIVSRYYVEMQQLVTCTTTAA